VVKTQASFDPEAIKLKVGLEIHQQIASGKKLFCACPIERSETLPLHFERKLRPSQSELGHIDPAAIFEYSKGKTNVYRWHPASSCLVEADEEPPHLMNEEAVEATISIAQVLRSNVVDEIHVMRKIVIDGSNTSGFQRTAVIALGGVLSVDGEEVPVQTVTLEEDAARILGEDAHSRFFALDRLGVPLVEIALAPITASPSHVEKVALYLGRALRSTGRVARGLGTIRQDLNISTMNGSVVEVKGVQKLNLVAKVVAYEAMRQSGLAMITSEIRKKGIRRVRYTIADVTDNFGSSSSRVLRRAIKAGERIICLGVKGLSEMLGFEPYPGVRLGRELAEIAKANSLGGVIHSDEFREQGVSKGEESSVRRKIGVGKDSVLILLAGEKARASAVANLLVGRLEEAVKGVPGETRAATQEGETRYMRPRPGAARMYPETDIPEIVLTTRRRERILESIPTPWQEKVKEYEKRYALSEEMAMRVYDSERAALFEDLAAKSPLSPSVISTLLIELPVRLSREGITEEKITDEVLVELLRAIGDGRVAKEAAPDILRMIGRGEAESIDEARGRLGLGRLTLEELKGIIEEVLRKNRPMLLARGEKAFSPLMGEVMKEVRGRVDGQLVSDTLREILKRGGRGTR